MIDALFNQPNYVGVKKLLDATALRHEAIASNLANLERPGYRRLDLAPNFQSELRQALRSGEPTQVAALTPKLAVDVSAGAQNRDGNTVKLEPELMRLNENALAHTLETQLVSSALLKLRLAITGRAA